MRITFISKDIIFISCLIICTIAAIGGGIYIHFYRKQTISSGILGSQAKSSGVFRMEGVKQTSVNTPFQIKFISNSGNQAVNAVSLLVTFDPEKLTILGVDTSQSFCQFYPENKYSNTRGTITISCGTPNPGYKGESTIAIVNFQAKNVGETPITITDKSQILLNDGKGTNIFNAPLEHSLLILNNI